MALVGASYYPRDWDFKYDVFLSFTEDTRYGFAGHMYQALIRKKFKTFIKDEGLTSGDELSPTLGKAIEGSRISIIVFSENYAASTQCLDELVKILHCVKFRGLLVVPVFYKIDPSIIRHQRGSYGKAMADHEDKFSDAMDRVTKWRSALSQVADHSGWPYEGYEYKFVKKIVEDVSKRLDGTIFPVGFDSPISQLGLLLKKGNGMVGIYEKEPVSGVMLRNINAEAISRAQDQLVFFGGRLFDLEGLVKASGEVLGIGAFGTAFKGDLENGEMVAVKELKYMKLSDNEFKEKIAIIGTMDHENLVPLRAYYCNHSQRLLIYDYISMGSLSELLHGSEETVKLPLNWEMRLGIALGAARGIKCLHSYGPNVSHGNIKSSNILVTEAYEARVSDYCLALFYSPSSFRPKIVGYHAPEVTDPHNVSQKADIYGFGVLLLELLTGKIPADSLLDEEGIDLPNWVQSIDAKRWSSEVFDPELLRYHEVEHEMMQLLKLSIDCVATNPDKRPSISKVTKCIEELHQTRLKNEHPQQPDVVNDADAVSSRSPVMAPLGLLVDNGMVGIFERKPISEVDKSVTMRNFDTKGIKSREKDLVFCGSLSRMFDLHGLVKASAVILGIGTFGRTYKAILETGIVVTVKELKGVKTKEREFKEKVQNIGAMNHENLLSLRAYYYNTCEQLLVYDYMPKGNLSQHLHGSKGRRLLNWKMRLGIAYGAAQGIQYIHSQGPDVSHGKIKSSNILLTKSYEALVSGYCLPLLVGSSSTTTRVAGYHAPEVVETHKVSQKADVYSFGLLLLELLTGKAPTDPFLIGKRVELPRLEQNIDREKWTSECFDLDLLKSQNNQEEMFQLLEIAITCLTEDPNGRPSISEVARRIKELQKYSFKGDHVQRCDVIDDADVESSQ